MTASAEHLMALAADWLAQADAADRDAAAARAGGALRSTATDGYAAAFHDGVSAAYRAAALALTAVLAAADAGAHRAAPHRAGAGAPPAPEPAQHQALGEDRLRAALAGAGLHPRHIHAHADGVCTAVFPRVGTHTQAQRIAAVEAAPCTPGRLVVLEHGHLRDTGEPYLDIAWAAG
jgi:hypothetical protein